MQTSDKADPLLPEPATLSAVMGGRLRVAAPSTEHVLSGDRALSRAFSAAPLRTAERGDRLAALPGREPEVMRLRSGFAFRSCAMPDGRRAILDVLTSGDILGLDWIVTHPLDECVAASRVSFRALAVADLRRMMADHGVALQVSALLVEARWRAARLAVAIGRLDARARICLFLLDIHDRLFRRGLIIRPTYNLPLTQEQMADHLGLTVVHVNRTLKRLREARLVLLDRQVVIILDLPRLRQMIEGVLQPPETIARPAYADADLPGAALAPSPARGSIEETLKR